MRSDREGAWVVVAIGMVAFVILAFMVKPAASPKPDGAPMTTDAELLDALRQVEAMRKAQRAHHVKGTTETLYAARVHEARVDGLLLELLHNHHAKGAP